MGWTDDAGRRGGQERFEDIVLVLPDEEYEYGSREMRHQVVGKRAQEFGGPNYQITSISRMGRPISTI